MIFRDVFRGSKDLPFWAFAIRATLLYFALIAVTRWMGHRQVGILSGHNYLVAAGIVSLAAVRMVNAESSLTSALVIVFVYAGMNVLLSRLDIVWPAFIDRKPVVLVQQGRINKRNMLGSHVTIDNLLGQLRLKGAFKLSDVAAAVLEPTGRISVLKAPESLPVARQQMNLPQIPAALTTVLVYDGHVDEHALRLLALTRKWLDDRLARQGLARAEDAFLVLLEDDGTLSISV